MVGLAQPKKNIKKNLAFGCSSSTGHYVNLSIGQRFHFSNVWFRSLFVCVLEAPSTKRLGIDTKQVIVEFSVSVLFCYFLDFV